MEPKSISVNGQEFTVNYLDSDNKNATGSVREKLIIIKIPKHWPYKHRIDAAAKLEKRIMKRLLNPKIEINQISCQGHAEKQKIKNEALPGLVRKVLEFNASYFGSEIGRVKIKENITNWGSCSLKNNININFALLFLPQELLDYVIVHELAHTKERNHSQRFWKLVESAMPDYKEKKKKLKEYRLRNTS